MFLFLLSEVVEFHGYTISYSESNESCFGSLTCNREGLSEEAEGENNSEDRLHEVRRPNRSRGQWNRRVCASGSVRHMQLA